MSQHEDEIVGFTETMDSFLILAEKIFQYDVSGKMLMKSSGQNNGMKTAFLGYKAIYNRTRSPPKKHMEKMAEVYAKCRTVLMKDEPIDEFMLWFHDNTSFVISPTATSKNKLYLTSIFRNCSRIAMCIAEEAKKNPDKANDLLNDPAAVYPEQFTLYLLRMFYHCAEASDKNTIIKPKIEQLESMLSLDKNETPSTSDGISDIFSVAADIASGIGLNIPNEMKDIDKDQFKQIINEFSSNDDMKNTIKSFFSGVDIKNANDLPGAITKVFSKMQETADTVPEPVRRSLEAKAED